MTVTALEDLELLLLQPETVMDLAQRNPGFAQEMEQILEARRKAVHHARRPEEGRRVAPSQRPGPYAPGEAWGSGAAVASAKRAY